MPWPGTNIPAPWDPTPAPTPPDTTQRDTLVKKLADQHGGQVGAFSTPMVKNPKDPSGPEIPGPYDLYSFADETTVEIAPTGEVSKYTPKEDKASAGWTDITQVRNKDQSITFYGRDPKDPSAPPKPIPGMPASAAPESVKTEPSKLEDLRKLDADGNDASKSGKPPVKLYDDKTGQSYPIDRDKPSFTSFGDDFIQVNPDGTTKVLLSKPDKPTTTNVPGVGLVEYDPATHTGKTLVATPKGLQANQVQPQVSNGKTYVPYDTDEGVKFKEAEGLPSNVTWTSATNDPRSKYIQLIGSNGETKNIDKPPDWKPPPSPQAGQSLTPDTTAPFVVTIGDNGKPLFTKNDNQLSISDAQKQLIQQLGLKVADGTMSEDAAKNLISSATSTMTAQASQQNAAANMITAQTGQQRLGIDAANNVITGVNNAAQTGANLLQNRVTSATGALNQFVGGIANNKSILNWPSGAGEAITNGLQEWVTQLGGGQPVYDAAAAMVNAAHPDIKGDPTAMQQAYTALRGMMDLYKQQTGQDYVPPAQRGQGGFTAQTTLEQPQAATAQNNSNFNPQLAAANVANAQNYNPQASTAQMNAGGYPDTPAGRALMAAPPAPGVYNPTFQQQYPSAVGQPATGPVVGAIQPIPIAPYTPFPYNFQSPVTS